MPYYYGVRGIPVARILGICGVYLFRIAATCGPVFQTVNSPLLLFPSPMHGFLKFSMLQTLQLSKMSIHYHWLATFLSKQSNFRATLQGDLLPTLTTPLILRAEAEACPIAEEFASLNFAFPPLLSFLDLLYSAGPARRYGFTTIVSLQVLSSSILGTRMLKPGPSNLTRCE